MGSGPNAAERPLARGTTNPREGSHVDARVPGGKLFFFQPATAEVMVCDAGAPAEAVRTEAALLEGLLTDLGDARGELAAALQKYDQAQANKQPKNDHAIAAALDRSQTARDKLLKEFKELSEANNGKELMELLPLRESRTGKPVFGGKKFTYVRSSRVKSHFRSYRLSGADKPEMKSFLMWRDGKGWKLDHKKLKESFHTIKPRIKVAEQVDGSWLPDNWSPAFVDGFNGKMHFGAPEDKQSPDAVIAFSGEAHLLRFFGGASRSKAVNISSDAFQKALAGEGSVAAEYQLRGALGIDLANARAAATIYLPWRSGIELWIPAAYQDCTLGHFRLLLKVEVKGSCGASVLGEGGVEFKLSRDKTRQGMKGSADRRSAQGLVSPRLNVKGAGTKATADAGAEITAFAGAEGGAMLHGAFEWQQPAEVRFAEFASIEPGITAQFGIGGTACFHVTYEDGKFRIKAKMGAAAGVGLKGEILAVIGAGQIVQFALWFKHQVVNAMDQDLEYFGDEAFKLFCKMCALAIVEGKQLSAYVGMAAREVETDLVNWVNNRREEFLRRLQSANDQLVNSIAEVKGILLYELHTIQREVQRSARKLQQGAQQLQDGMQSIQRAIQNIMNSVYLRNELTNVFQHASADGARIDDAEADAMIAWVDANSGMKVATLAATLKTQPTPGYPMVANNTSAYRMNNGIQIAWQRGTLPAPDDTRFA